MLDRRNRVQRAASAIRRGHEPDLITRSQQDLAVRPGRQQRGGQLTASHVCELALDRQAPQAASGGNPDLLFRCRDGRRDTHARRSSANASAAHGAAFGQGAFIVELILDPCAFLLALVDAEKIEDVLLVVGADARLAMRGWLFDVLHPPQRRAVFSQQDNCSVAHGSHPIPGGRHAFDSTSEGQRPGLCAGRAGKTQRKHGDREDEQPSGEMHGLAQSNGRAVP